MARVRVIHWKANEAAALLSVLRAAGHTVEYDEEVDTGTFRAIRQSPPDAVVIDLSRRPSHGREVATFLRSHKATRPVPLVFVEGEPAKVEAVRKVLPDAVYSSAARLRPALQRGGCNGPAARHQRSISYERAPPIAPGSPGTRGRFLHRIGCRRSEGAA